MKNLKDAIYEKLDLDNVVLRQIPDDITDFENIESISVKMGQLQSFASKNGYIVNFWNKKTNKGDFSIPIYEYNGRGIIPKKSIKIFYGDWKNASGTSDDKGFQECYLTVANWILKNSRAKNI